MKRLTLIILAATTIATLVALPVLIRGSLRYYAVDKILKNPEVRQRLEVMPTRRTIDSPKAINPVNIGYATFDLGLGGPVSIEARGSSGTALVITNSGFLLVFLAPSPPPKLNQSEAAAFAKEAVGHPKMAQFIQQQVTDPIDAEMRAEEICPLPLSKVFLMSKEEFLMYTTTLGLKCLNSSYGKNGVYFFTTPHIKGIVRIGKSPQDHRMAWSFLGSLDGKKNLGCGLYLSEDSAKDIRQVFDPILGSFQFTTNNVGNPDEIRNLIIGAGIPHRKYSQQDTPADRIQRSR